MVQWNKKMRNSRRDRAMYCRFQKEVEHNTNDCYKMKEAIQHLIKRVHLKNLCKIKGYNNNSNTKPSHQENMNRHMDTQTMR